MKTKLLVVIPFNLPWEWSTDYTNQTAFVLGQKNTVICYMWSDYMSLKEYIVKRKFPILIKRYSKNIYLYYPILLIPFRRFEFIVRTNEKLNIFLLNIFVSFLGITRKFNKKILWIFDPQTESMMKYFNKGWKIVYDCVDYFIGTATDKKRKEFLIKSEQTLTKKADLVVANSKVLRMHLEKIRKNIQLVPQGFRIDTFKNYLESKSTPVLKRSGRPLVGFVGAVNYRIDYELIYKLAKKNKSWDFAIWGPVLQTDLFSDEHRKYLDLLQKLPNLIFGKSDKKEIPGIVSQFDIGMIPYIPDDDFNKYCYPMKLFEFFYVGCPVVSIKIEELKRFPDLVRIASTPKQWEDAITELIKNKWPINLKKKQMRLAIENSWSNKVSQIVKNL